MSERLLLDTHVWLWQMLGDTRLAPGVIERIDAVARSGDGATPGVLVSPISIWEVGMLEAKQRITLDRDVRGWVEAALATPGVGLAPLTPPLMIDATRLPGDFHGDPADRMLVATARALGVTLVTHDLRIRQWAVAGHVSVLAT